MRKNIFILMAVSAVCLCGCGKNYNKVLDNLRTELAQSGDSLLAYSIDKRFAIWVHEDTTNTYDGHINAYYYDLDKKEKMLLFKTGDSLFSKSDNEKIRLSVWGVSNVSITPDSLGLIIFAEGESTYLYPLSKRDTLFEIFSVLADNSFSVLEQKIFIDLEDVFFAGIEVHYNSYGDVIFKPDSATAYNVDYEPIYKFPKELLNNQEELKQKIIIDRAYTIEDVYRGARNEVRFKEDFTDRQNYYKLNIIAIKAFDTDYRVDGTNFSFFTEDNVFADLNYPNSVIIKATVSDIRQVQNSFLGAYMTAQFDIFSGGRRNPNADFMFKNCELLYHK